VGWQDRYLCEGGGAHAADTLPLFVLLAGHFPGLMCYSLSSILGVMCCLRRCRWAGREAAVKVVEHNQDTAEAVVSWVSGFWV
jgi:hypothetical protein